MISYAARVLMIALFGSISLFAQAKSEELSSRAVSEDVDTSKAAIAVLREQGQKGLDAIIKVHSAQIAAHLNAGRSDPSWQRLTTAIDKIAMQKDAFASGLFWHTDLESAKAKAKRSGKLLLSLRLLGNLNDEYSCANSRFFRSILYSNPDISQFLKENFILHWQSVRPAPLMTIDFGDGRKIVRTVTGNSIHYVLDSNGGVIDALPGLYSPGTFLDYLRAYKFLGELGGSGPQFWKEFRVNQRQQLLDRWEKDLRIVSPGASVSAATEVRSSEVRRDPSAVEAASRAITKAAVELTSIRSITLDPNVLNTETDFEEWRALAELYGRTVIHPDSVKFIGQKTKHNKKLGEKEFERLIENLEKYVTLDTVRNEYLLHTNIYDLLNSGSFNEIEKLNEKIYSDIFLTPSTDKWLGLYSPDIYSALENNGIIQ